MGTAVDDALASTMVYTTDGNDPIATSTAYSAPIVIGITTTLKVAALKDGFVGKPGVFTYSIGGTSVQNPENTTLSVYPTIVENMLNISTLAERVQVMDLAGKSLITKANVNNVDLSSIH